MFTVTPHANGLIEATLSGFLDVEEVRRYADIVAPAIRKMVARHGRYVMLLDVSDCAIQSQDVVAAFIQHAASVPRARRCAVVTGSSIIRMQVRRILQGPAMRMIADASIARAWLAEELLAPAH